MKNLKASVILKTRDEKTSYDVDIFINEKESEITYIEKDQEKTFVSYNYMNNILKRDNNSLYMEFDFNNSIGFILFKEINQKTNISLQVEKIIKTNDIISVKYYYDGKNYEYKITKT